MAEIQRMPKSGYTMTEGKVISINVKTGDLVAKGDVLMEYETDKLVGQVTATVGGTILEIYVKEGDSVEVQGKLCLIGEKGETVSLKASMPVPSVTAVNTVPVLADEKPQAVHSGSRIIASPVAKKIAAEKGINLASIKGSGPGGRIEKKDVEDFTGVKDVKTTPAAALIAAERGINLGTIQGSGVNGRIHTADLQQQTGADSHTIDYYLEGISEPMSTMRKVIAKRMLVSKQEIPHVYYKKEIDASSILNVRENFAEAFAKKYNAKLSINDILIKAVSQVLIEFPLINARVDRDSVFYYKHVNIGLAVGIEGGLIVPVIHGAESKTLYEISREATTLVRKAREGVLKGDECSGGTFTVTNLGMFGLDEFSAVINPPEAAILAVGAVKEKAVFRDGICVPVKTMVLTLSADHRIADGVLAAQFMKRLADILEDAYMIII